MNPTAFDPLPQELSEALDAAAPRLCEFARVHYLAETGSTNDLALGLAAAGAPEGTSVLADLQRDGRGRRGRSWFSPPGAGIYLSVIVRPGPLAGPWSLVTLVAGVAVAHAVSSVTALPVELKWPNDLVIGRPWRKLGGVLCESVGVGARVDAVVVGIGINVQQVAYPSDIGDKATSLETELGRAVDRVAVIVECLAQLRDGVSRLRAAGPAWVGHEWRQFGRAGLAGAVVRWVDQGAERRGIARDIDDSGALVVEVEGRLERLIAGEVLWERLLE